MTEASATFKQSIDSALSINENLTTRQMVIEQGLDYLSGLGADQICNICIANGGSCCKGCRNLAKGSGCKLRNTSCTAWLCGFLRYFLYEIDLLDEWNAFWEQVPGQDFREDYTPEIFVVYTKLIQRNLRFLSRELAEDLKTLSDEHPKQNYILDIREKLECNLNELIIYNVDLCKQTFIKNNIRALSKDFYRFHQALENYRKDDVVSQRNRE